MVHVSPCGWFCFGVPDGWKVFDTPESMDIVTELRDTTISINSARKKEPVTDQDLWEMQEDMLEKVGPHNKETSRMVLPQGIECLYTACYNDSHAHVFCYLFWSHYCVALEMKTVIDYRLGLKMDALRYLLETMESLTVD